MAGRIILEALREVWAKLQQLGCPMAVMGGIAVSVYKHDRATKDVDVLIHLGSMAPDAVIACLIPLGFRPKLNPPVLQIEGMRILPFLYDPSGTFIEIQIDLLLADCEFQGICLDRRRAARLPGLDMEFQVLSVEDLILHKLLAGRIIDRADAAYLLRANRSTMDFAYFWKWANQLGLEQPLNEIWGEAFPGEPMPAAPP